MVCHAAIEPPKFHPYNGNLFVCKAYLNGQRWVSSYQSSTKFKEEKKVHTATKLKLHLASKYIGGWQPKYANVNDALPCILHEKQEEVVAIFNEERHRLGFPMEQSETPQVPFCTPCLRKSGRFCNMFVCHLPHPHTVMSPCYLFRPQVSQVDADGSYMQLESTARQNEIPQVPSRNARL